MSVDIHPAAIVSPGAKLGEGVSVGAFTLIGEGVEIGAGTVVESHCVIGKPTKLARESALFIGPRSLIRSHSTLYMGSEFGEGLRTGDYVTLRENIRAGEHFQAGSYGEFQGDMVIGRHVRTQSRVYVSKGAAIGDFVWIFTGTSLANDPHPPGNYTTGVRVRDYAVLSMHCFVMAGVEIGEGAVVGAGSVVTRDVPEAMLAVGNPARVRGPAESVMRRDTPGQPAYPWTRHFHRGYPEEVVRAWGERFAPD